MNKKSWKEQHIVLRLTAVFIFAGLALTGIAMLTGKKIESEFTAIFLGSLAVWEVLNTIRYKIKKNGEK